MKIIDFEHINEKQKANSIDLSELKDVVIDMDDMSEFTVHKSDLKLFDIVETKKHDLHMAFAGSTATDIFDIFSQSDYFIKTKLVHL